ncbi:retinol dehydrogenase 16-like, partial [Grammomys surdaster]|uniref:retinol dehydrogenase 16-like n=1 Tax=Grammomys surdaster TaxID=491861 RepID=UPI00109F2FDA
CEIQEHTGDALITRSFAISCTSQIQRVWPFLTTGSCWHATLLLLKCSHCETSEVLDICLPCRRELSYFGVKVAIIEPGHFKTGMTSRGRLSSSFQMLWDQTSSEIREIYGEKYLAFNLKKLDGLDQLGNKDLSLVTDCMEHALTACHPRTRYSAGWDAKLYYLPLSYLPTSLVDALLYWTSPKPEKAL